MTVGRPESPTPETTQSVGLKACDARRPASHALSTSARAKRTPGSSQNVLHPRTKFRQSRSATWINVSHPNQKRRRWCTGNFQLAHARSIRRTSSVRRASFRGKFNPISARETPHRRGLKILADGECSRSYAFGRLPRFALFLRRSLRLRPRLLMVPPLKCDELGANLVTKYSVYRRCHSVVKSPEEILREAPAKA